jgi:Cu/Ag efflux pump CusA
MNKISDVIEAQILAVPEVRQVGRRLGRAERGDHVVPVSTAEFDVDFRELVGHEGKSARSRAEILADLNRRLKTIPGVFAVVGGPLAATFGDVMFAALRDEVDRRACLGFLRPFEVVPASLGNDAALVGAVALGRSPLRPVPTGG